MSVRGPVESFMAEVEYEFNPVTRITTGAVGPPGKRVFYLQVRKDDLLLTLIVEKQQIQSLAVGVEQFLVELHERFPHLSESHAHYDEDEMMLEEPIDPAFRVGQLGLAYEESSDMLVLVAREIEVEGQEGASPETEGGGSVARLWCTRSQLRAMCHWGLEIASRGRKICGNCGQPIDPEGHFCPKRNGHKH